MPKTVCEKARLLALLMASRIISPRIATCFVSRMGRGSQLSQTHSKASERDMTREQAALAMRSAGDAIDPFFLIWTDPKSSLIPKRWSIASSLTIQHSERTCSD